MALTHGITVPIKFPSLFRTSEKNVIHPVFDTLLKHEAALNNLNILKPVCVIKRNINDCYAPQTPQHNAINKTDCKFDYYKRMLNNVKYAR